MKNRIAKVVLAVLTVGLLQGQLGLGAGVQAQKAAPQTKSPEKSFEYLWKTFDDKYALFDAKGVDWKALYRVYRPKVTQATTDDELFQILSNLLGHLNDNHVTLSSKNPDRFFSAGCLYQLFSGTGGSANAYEAFQKMMAERPVPKKYLAKGLQERAGGIFAYGWAGDGVGYFHFNRFTNLEASRQAIDEIVKAFRDAKAIIIDVRRNMGGDDRVGKMIADRFADKKRLYMTTRNRNGPSHGSFASPKEWYVEPDGPAQFTKTVLLLADRTSVSAAENFALAMKVLPHVVQIGDLTSGCFADSAGAELPNGWSFSYSYNLFTDHRGFCWEGIGVPPEIRQVNTEADLRQDRDHVFELAVAISASGGLEPKQVTGQIGSGKGSLGLSTQPGSVRSE
jgi:carboxyl-terminal processing protease